MAITIYTWENHKWIEHGGTTSLDITCPTYNNNSLVLNLDLASGSIEIQVYYVDSDIPGNKSFSLSQLSSTNEVTKTIMTVNTVDSYSIPIPNPYNYDYVRLIITAAEEPTVTGWIKPASSVLRGID